MVPILLGVLLLAGPPAACDLDLSGAIGAAWRTLGGAEGELGCPTTGISATAPSPQGQKGLSAQFGAAGAIYTHASGPRAGQTFAVTGCDFTLYFQYGGPGGWLGLPISDPVNTPDGQRQRFEGGTLIYQRAQRLCSAERDEAPGTAPAAMAAPSEIAPLDLFLDPARGDYLSAASARTVASARDAHYQRVRTEALVAVQPGPGAVPLKLYWNETRGAHDTVATKEGEREALAAGGAYEGLQGYVLESPAPGTTPLRQYVNPEGRRLLVATPDGEAEAAAHGYVFQRIEGYAFPAAAK